MKFSISIILGIIAAGVSVVLISSKGFFTAGVNHEIAYYFIPLILSILITIIFFKGKKFFYQLLVGLITYGLLMSIAELFVYHVGTTFYFPTGYPYSDYKLHALYPMPGLLICGGAFIAVLLVANIFAFAKRVSDNYYTSHSKTEEHIKE